MKYDLISFKRYLRPTFSGLIKAKYFQNIRWILYKILPLETYNYIQLIKKYINSNLKH